MELLNSLPDLDRNSYKPLYMQLGDLLVAHIRKNQLKGGELLPSEKALTDRFQVSRMTTRLAIQRLEREGLVYKIQGKGTFVAQSDSKGQIQGFKTIETQLGEQGFEITNILLELKRDYPPRWAECLNELEAEQVQLIRRKKRIDNKAFAIEMRALPIRVANLFSEDQLSHRPSFELLMSHQDTQICQVSYGLNAGLVS